MEMEKEINYVQNTTRIKNKIEQLQKKIMKLLKLMLPGKNKVMLQGIEQILLRMALLVNDSAWSAPTAAPVASTAATGVYGQCKRSSLVMGKQQQDPLSRR